MKLRCIFLCLFLCCIISLAGCTIISDLTLPYGIPRTQEQAVLELKTKWLSKEDLDWILRNPKDQVTSTMHMPFGVGVRNAWHIGSSNSKLMSSTGAQSPDECTGIIFAALWNSVRTDADSALVRSLGCQFKLTDSVNIYYGGFDTLRIADMLKQVQVQIDRQDSSLSRSCCGETSPLFLKVVGHPNLQCWTQTEWGRGQAGPVSLGQLLASMSWRNGFSFRHCPPNIELTFQDSCVGQQSSGR